MAVHPTHVTFEGALSPAECAEVLERAADIAAVEGAVGSGAGKDKNAADASTRRSIIRWLPREGPLAWVYDRVLSLMLAANDEAWRYEITELENIQIGSYTGDEAGYYDWHVDRSVAAASASQPDRVLSGSIQLSDGAEYEGGELQLGAIVAPREQGSALIFPSYAMHSVHPVVAGLRSSLVLWLQGKPSASFERDAIASHLAAISALEPDEPPEMQVRRPACELLCSRRLG